MLAHRWNHLFTHPSRSAGWDSLFGGLGLDPARLFAEGSQETHGLRINVADTDEAVFVEAEVPGLTLDQLEVVLEGRELTLTADRSEEREEGGEVRLQERRVGKFGRVLRLPVDVAADEVSAKLENGVLTITLPKEPAARAKRIEIRN